MRTVLVNLQWKNSPSVNLAYAGVKVKVTEPDGTVRKAEIPVGQHVTNQAIWAKEGSTVEWSVVSAGKNGQPVDSVKHTFVVGFDGAITPAYDLVADAVEVQADVPPTGEVVKAGKASAKAPEPVVEQPKSNVVDDPKTNLEETGPAPETLANATLAAPVQTIDTSDPNIDPTSINLNPQADAPIEESPADVQPVNREGPKTPKGSKPKK